MNTIFFTNSIQPDEAKKLYRHLANIHHPDHGGDLATMQEINSQYAAYLAHQTIASERTRQTEAHAQGKKTTADFNDLDEVEKILKQKIEAALNIDSLIVELCGLWIWLTGQTREHKDEIKAIGGFRWSHEKSAWYYPGVKTFNRQHHTLEQIREMHGSNVFTRQNATRQQEELLPA